MTRDYLEALIRAELTGVGHAMLQRPGHVTRRMNQATDRILAAAETYVTARDAALRAALAGSDTPYNVALRRTALEDAR